MKKLFTLSLFLFSIQVSFSQMSKWEENFVRTYDPQTYSYYRFGQGISNQGKQIANSLSRQLDRYQSLISTQDPDALLADFQSKMQNIQNLEQRYVENANTFAYNAGQQIGNAINRKDGMAAISGLIGFADQMSAQKEAKRKLEAQKAKLRQQRINKMSQVYWKAVKFNDGKIQEYINRAAYARNIKDEKYNLEFVKNLKCFAGDMKRYWSSISTGWLTNRCTKPVKPNINSIENKFIAKDVQTRKVAERKYKFYLESKYEQFRSAAISYAAAAAKQNGSAANYFLLGKYYLEENPILGLSTLLTVQSINPNYKKEELNYLIQQATDDTTRDIRKALSDNDVSYLNSFLNSGLDRLIKIDGKSILTEAITLDKPDAVQTILNKYIDGLPQNKINEKIKKTIMLCALKDASQTISRFSNLGVSVDFRLGKYHPIDLAVRANATKSYKKLLQLSDERAVFKQKYKSNLTTILLDLEDNPSSTISELEQIDNKEIIEEAVDYLFKNFTNKKNVYQVLFGSPKLKKFIKENEEYTQKTLDLFIKGIETNSSVSADLLRRGYVEFEDMPIYGDLTGNKEKTEIEESPKEKKEVDVTIEFKIDAIIRGIEEYIATLTDPTQKRNMESGLGIWKQWKSRSNNLKDMEINAVNTSYPPFAKKYGLPLGKSTPISTSFIGYDYPNLNLKSIALVAYSKNNIELFKALDEQFDLNEIVDDEGVPLKKNLLKDIRKFISNGAYFMSQDIELTDDELSMIISEMIKNSVNIGSLKGFLIAKSLKNYQFTDSYGTFLHAYVEALIQESKGEKPNISSSSIKSLITGMSIDKTLEDKNGLTAYELYKKNYSKIKKALRLKNKESLGGGGLINGIANKMMRKDQEQVIEDLLKPTEKRENELIKSKTKDILVKVNSLKLSNKSNDLKQLLNLFKNNNLDINDKLDNQGNTLLHLIVKELQEDLLYKDSKGGRWKSSGELDSYNRFLVVVNSGIDKSIKNQNDQTALDLFKQKKGKIILNTVTNLKVIKRNLENMKEARGKMTKEQFMKLYDNDNAASSVILGNQLKKTMREKAEREWSKGIVVPSYNAKDKANEIYQAIVKALEY